MHVGHCPLCCSRTDHWSVCPHVIRLDGKTAVCRWLMVDGRNSLRYDLPYTLYVSAVNALGRASSTPLTVDTASVGTPCSTDFSRTTTVKLYITRTSAKGLRQLGFDYNDIDSFAYQLCINISIIHLYINISIYQYTVQIYYYILLLYS